MPETPQSPKKKMTPQEALALIGRALPTVVTDLNSHMALHEALLIVKNALPKK